MREDEIVVGPKEQKRALALNRHLAGEWTEEQTAGTLGLSVRQVRRLKRGYREEGIGALIHGNRGRTPTHRLTDEMRSQILVLARTRYAGCNDQHLCELLSERESLTVSRSSVRRILRGAGLASPRKRRAPKHRSRRERYPQEGMLLQIDGSRHDWLEGRGPYLSLIGAIDDATGQVPYAVFRAHEDAQGYFLLVEGIVRGKGVPQALYRDRHGIFERSPLERETIEEQLAGKREPTQFGRLLDELGIVSIAARSPQAKGRVERLWGTLQDRLVSELRLAGASTIEEANRVLHAFLPRFNQHFVVPAALPGTAYGRPPGTAVLRESFCFKYQRTVAADNTVQLGEHRFQLLAGPHHRSYAKLRVEVHERMDGSLAVFYQGRQLASKSAPPEAPLLRARDAQRAPGVRPSSWSAALDKAFSELPRPALVENGRPAKYHPWRHGFANNGGQNH